jgi:hypothetical protein
MSQCLVQEVPTYQSEKALDELIHAPIHLQKLLAQKEKVDLERNLMIPPARAKTAISRPAVSGGRELKRLVT